MDKKTEKTWDFLVENMVATEAELSLVTSINGYNIESLNSVIYARTTYHDLDQLIASE